MADFDLGRARGTIEIDTSSAERSASRVSSRIGKSLSSVGRSLRRVGIIAGAAFAAATVIGIKKSIDAASDLNESMSKVSVVFGDSAKDILAWSQTSATALGISRQQALEAAGTFGNLFTAMKIGVKPAKDMSTNIVGLASDLASFNNQNPEDVLLALRAGLVGEAEPLRKFGINITAAATAQEAMNLGIAKQGDELTAAQKAQANYSLIMKQSTTAQGDFARTSDGVANRQRIVAAQFSNLSARIGKFFLPVVAKVLAWASQAIGWFSRMIPTFKRWGAAIQQSVADKVEIVSKWIQTKLVPVLLSAWQILQDWIPVVLSVATAIGKTLWDAINLIITFLTSFIRGIAEGSVWARTLAAAILGLVAAIWIWNTALKAIALAMRIAAAAQAIFNAVMTANPIALVIAAIIILAAIIIANWGKIKRVTMAVWGAIKRFIIGIWGGIKSAWSAVTGFFGGIFGGVWNVAKTIFGRVKDFVVGIWRTVKSAWGAATGFFAGIGAGVLGAFKGMVNGIIGAMNWAIDGLNFALNAIDIAAGPLVNFGEIPHIPALAKGVKNFRGGIAMVGEEGPEMLRLPRGSDIIPNDALRTSFHGGSSGPERMTVILEVDGEMISKTVELHARETRIKMGGRR